MTGGREKKIRILHVAQAAGGVDRYIRLLLKYVNRSAFEHILLCSEDYRKEDYAGLLLAFEQLPLQREIGPADCSAVFAVRRLIRKYQPDIVYAHSSKAGALARLAHIGLPGMCIYNPHGWAFHMRCKKGKKLLYCLIERLAALFCQKIVCISETERRLALEARICKARKLRRILNGVDVAAYDRQDHPPLSRETLGIPEDALVIGMLGRISPQKAPDVFIKAARWIKQALPQAYFVMVGAGEMEEEISAYAKKQGIEDCLCITGWVAEPMSYVELFDIALLLSRWEGFGLALAEYMLARKPIVASRTDAIPELIRDAENGLLVEADNVKAVYAAVLHLAKNAALGKRLAEAAWEDVHRKFDARRMAREHAALFLECRDAAFD